MSEPVGHLFHRLPPQSLGVHERAVHVEQDGTVTVVHHKQRPHAPVSAGGGGTAEVAAEAGSDVTGMGTEETPGGDNRSRELPPE
ncbi:hypothetical protein ACFWE4_32660, partial [Streptomyces sp. NPDC060187]